MSDPTPASPPGDDDQRADSSSSLPVQPQADQPGDSQLNETAPASVGGEPSGDLASPPGAIEPEPPAEQEGAFEPAEGPECAECDANVQVFVPPEFADEPAPEAEPTHAEAAAAEIGQAVILRYGLMRQIGEFTHNMSTAPKRGTKLVARTERGVELGEVLAAIGEDESCLACLSKQRLGDYIGANGPEYPWRRGGRILRLANSQDVIDQRHLDGSAREETMFCRQQIRELQLPMKLVTVEHLLGGERIIFYFSSEQRIDFRELVRRLAGQYRTRIEMRQVGARDEARLVGDYERCGQQCCCQAFLKALQPVSMRMAKTQKATLDPSKISGRCGRLMCCLRYEDATYEQLRKSLPKKNTWVRTSDGVVGRVLDSQILTQLVALCLNDNSRVAVAVESIVERDIAAPPPIEVRIRPERPQTDRSQRKMLRDDTTAAASSGGNGNGEGEVAAVAAGDIAGAEPADGEEGAIRTDRGDQPKKKRRRGRRKRRDDSAAPQQSQQQPQEQPPAAGEADSPEPATPSQDQSQQATPQNRPGRSSRRRRRRRN